MRTTFAAPSFAWQSGSKTYTQSVPLAMWKRVPVSTPIRWCEGLYLTWAPGDADNSHRSPTAVGFLAERLGSGS
jgi:hypothetical protein